MDALIFDFDGVIVDSEPIHLACFRHVLESRGCKLTREDYYSKYLGSDDHDAFLAVFRDQGKPTPGEAEVAAMTDEKTLLVKKALAEETRPLPGAVELIASAAGAGIPVAVCSGALKGEIELAVGKLGLRGDIATIVAARDVAHGKPDPEGYTLTVRKLIETTGRKISARRCLAVEDSPAGVAAAQAAGMKVLAVTSSYEAARLRAADRIVGSLAEVSVASLQRLFRD